LGLGVANGALVVLAGGELEVFGDFVEIFLQLLNAVELAFDVRALPKEGLRLDLIVPEIGRAGLLV
jgi:hypothetical protein